MIECEVCKQEIPRYDDGFLKRCAMIVRGDFNPEDATCDNVKFKIYIFQQCYLTDEDLCRFFNRLEHRVR